MLEDFYSGSGDKDSTSSEDEYDFERSASNERALTEEKNGKRMIKVCTGVPCQKKFGKTFSVFDKKPQVRKSRSIVTKTDQMDDYSIPDDNNTDDDDDNSDDDTMISTQKSSSGEKSGNASEISREPTDILDEEITLPKKRRKSLGNDKKVLRASSEASVGRQKRRSSRSPQPASSSVIANLSWDNESEDETSEITNVKSSMKKSKISTEETKPVNPSTYMEIIELAGMSQTVDDFTYAFDGFDNSAVKNDCCVQVLELCCQNSENISLIFRSKNFFAKLFDSIALADNNVFEFGLVAILFVLLSGDNQINNNSFYFNDDRAIQLMVKVLSRKDTSSDSHCLSKSDSSGSIQTSSKKRRRGSLLDAIRSSAIKSNSQSKSDAAIDPNITEIKKLLSPFPAFKGIPPEKITPELVAVESLSVLSASLANRRVKNEFIRLGVNGAIEATLLRYTNSDWISNPCSIRLIESCLSFVENAAYMNKDNQNSFTESGKLIPAIVKVMSSSLGSNNESVNEKTLLMSMKALINIVEKGGSASEQCANSGVFDIVTKELKTFMSKNMFDHSVLAIVLLINLTESSHENRVILGQKCDFIPTLTSMYRKADVFSDGNESQVFAAYCAVLLGCLSKDVSENADIVIQNGIYFDELSACVTEFVTFQSDAGILSTQARDSYLEVIEVFQKLDQFYKPKSTINELD